MKENEVPDMIQALWNIAGGLSGVKALIDGRKKIVDAHLGYEIREDGLITLKVIPHGHTGPEQKTYLVENGHVVTDYASQILSHKGFTTSSKGKEIQIGILTKDMVGDLDWTPDNAWKFIQETYDVKERPAHDVGGLLRENLTDKQIESMKLWGIATLSDPLKDSDGYLCSTGPNRRGDSGLHSWNVHPDRRYDSARGFAFVFPQQF